MVIEAAKILSENVSKLNFGEPVTHVYNPLEYAWAAHRQYLEKHGNNEKRVVFLGMNPGPWGMAQTGVPFGEISLVKEWIGVEADVDKPKKEHPKRSIVGFNCEKSEVSGRRLWGLFKDKFGTADAFFKDHFVANYCPLVFMEESSKNRTPDKLPASESKALYEACDEHLQALVTAMRPDYLVGVGAFAMSRAQVALKGMDLNIEKILHPSPASPAANRGWAEQATKQLEAMGVW